MNTLAEAIRDYLEGREEIAGALSAEGPRLLARLLKTRSLREIGRLTNLSPTYLSNVKNRKVNISPGAYLTLSELESK